MKRYSTIQKTIFTIVVCLTLTNYAYANSLTVKSPTETNAVIELYTSEGCSSCPPADKWLSSYAVDSKENENVITLAFHVDYWNYLGWEDIYSKPEYTERQRLLGSINKQRTIYTPEFFVNTTETRGTRQISSRIKAINGTPSNWTLTLTSSTEPQLNDELSVKFNAVSKTAANNTELFLALYENDISRKIERGENRNKTLNHDFVVREWLGPIVFESTREINYTRPISLPADSIPKNTGVAAILVDTETKEILQAVKSNLKPLFVSER